MGSEKDYSRELPPKFNGMLLGKLLNDSDTQTVKDGTYSPTSDRTSVPPGEPQSERKYLIEALLPKDIEGLEKEIQQVMDEVWSRIGEINPGVALYVLNGCLLSSHKRAKALLSRQIEGLSSEIEEASSRLEVLKGDYLKLERLEVLCKQ